MDENEFADSIIIGGACLTLFGVWQFSNRFLKPLDAGFIILFGLGFLVAGTLLLLGRRERRSAGRRRWRR